jgi:hypothetical protein
MKFHLKNFPIKFSNPALLSQLFLFVFFSFCLTYTVLSAEVGILLPSGQKKIDSSEIQKMLTAKSLSWEDGKSVVLVIDDLTTISNENFKKFTGLNKDGFLQLWRAKFFSGRAYLPRQVKSHEEAQQILTKFSNALYLTFKTQSLDKLQSQLPDYQLSVLNY